MCHALAGQHDSGINMPSLILLEMLMISFFFYPTIKSRLGEKIKVDDDIKGHCFELIMYNKSKAMIFQA